MNDNRAMEDLNWQDEPAKASAGEPNASRAVSGSDSARHTSERTGSSPLEPIRPQGISWVTVVIGVACLFIAATVLTVQLSDLRLAWNVATPAIVVSAGVLLLLAGAAGVVRGRADEEITLE